MNTYKIIQIKSIMTLEFLPYEHLLRNELHCTFTIIFFKGIMQTLFQMPCKICQTILVISLQIYHIEILKGYL